jgi:uncharacterized protein (TIGR03435 family)
MIASVHWPAPPTFGFITSALIDHLWQSTLCALAAWLLALALRHNQARVRYRLWMLASAKFLVPFSILVAAGKRMDAGMGAPAAQPAFSTIVDTVAQPFLVSSLTPAPTPRISQTASFLAAIGARNIASWVPLLLIAFWACGTLLVLARWARSWWLLRSAARAASPVASISGVPVLVTHTRVEPGVFGILRPALLLPQGIADRLNASQMDAILAHELCHVRRRDNLTAALHMLVEALFWFHPAVWWIRARLLDERERACDEAVLASSRDAMVYAEGILNVCRFYVETPLNCVSGVTGSDLRKRIARIMTEHVTRKLDVPRKLLLALAALLAVALPVSFGFVRAAQGQTQPAQKNVIDAGGIAGTWQGTLHAPNASLRTVLKIAKTPAGTLSATFYSIDQGGQGIPTTSVSFDGGVLKYAIQFADLTYEGKLSADGNSITGASVQGGNSLPLVFERATPDTEWNIPAPPPRIPPMAADANPSFEVATIKPTKPDEQRQAFVVQGRQFKTINMSVESLISISFGLQKTQIVGAPDWLASEKFDINAEPDVPGAPNKDQLMTMVQKLLADRFQLKFHNEKREMSAYILTVSKAGPKMTKNPAGPNDLPGFGFGPIGTLHVMRANMGDFTGFLQSNVLDRPVVNQTGLDGRWDFVLKWTPDQSQFPGRNLTVPQPADGAEAAPPLFTAIQEQLGLKLEAQKTPVEVMVIDHVDHPSPN